MNNELYDLLIKLFVKESQIHELKDAVARSEVTYNVAISELLTLEM